MPTADIPSGPGIGLFAGVAIGLFSQKGFVMQNSGNPVLDSLVNIVTSGSCPNDFAGKPLNDIKALHKTLRKLALKEPGGLKRPPALDPSA